MRADAVGDPIGLSMADAHPAVVDAERFRANLRHHSLEPLTEGRAAGDELHGAGGVHLDAHAVGGAEAALLDEHGKAGAHRLATGAPAGKLVLELGPIQ